MRYLRTTAAAAALTAVAVAFPAGAQDSPTAVSCFGTFFTDKAGDNVRGHPAFDGEAGTDNLDLLEGWFSQAGGETFVNIRVKDLDTTIPPGSTSAQWQLDYGGSAPGVSFVRAVVDFAGLVTYDYGGQQQGAVTLNVREGGTTGNFIEGPNGVVQIAIPADKEPKGTTLKGLTVFAYEPVQVIPPAAPTPVKGGQLYEQDTASGKGSHTLGQDCPPADPSTDPGGGDGSQGGPPQVDDGGPLPVTVRTKSAKRSKSIKVKLESSEPLTQVAAQLRKGKKVAGKGKLSRLDGKGTLKLKAKRKPKKGSYVLDLVGTDGEGARRFLSVKFRLR